MKKFLTMVLVLAMMLAMTACGGSDNMQEEDGAFNEASAELGESGDSSKDSEAGSTAVDEAVVQEVNAKVTGGWTLCGGLTNNVEWEQTDLDAVQAQYGGMLQVVFNGDGTCSMLQGGGLLEGTYEVVNADGVGMVFNNAGTELVYIAKYAEVDGTPILLFSADQVDYMYFAKIDEH